MNNRQPPILYINVITPLDNPNIRPYHRCRTNHPAKPYPIHPVHRCKLNMCNSNSLQRHIRRLTNNGEVIARFLTETVQGKTPHAKPCHQLEATKQLTRLGALDNTNTVGATLVVAHPNNNSTHAEPTHNPVRPEPVEGQDHTATPSRHSCESRNPHAQDKDNSATTSPLPPQGEGWDGGEDDNNPTHPVSSHNPVHSEPVEEPTLEVTYLDIINFELAQLVRSETAEGHTIAEFLYDVVTGNEEPFTPKKLRIKPADRMTAAMEILRRGYGHFGRRRKLVDDIEEANDYDTLHTDLAKRMRQYGDHGSDVIRFLLDVMHNTYPDEEFTMRHRVSAAQELTRRGWDTNFDKIKMEHLVDYWRDQQDAILSVGQKKQLVGLQAFVDEYDAYDDKTLKDYKALAKDVHAQQDRESDERERQRKERQRSESDSNRHSSVPDRLSRESGKPEGQGGAKNPTHHVHPVSYEDENPTHHASSDPDPEQDFYYEPLSPEDQSLFDYYDLIESGNYKEGEIQPRPVTETTRLGYEATLKWMRESAAAEGVPLLPNPLSGTLKHPNPTARSP